MSDDLTDFEMQILRETAGELPPSPWEATVGTTLEFLRGRGLLDARNEITDEGRAVLAAVN